MAKLDFQKISTLASEGGYSGLVLLSNLTAAITLSSGGLLRLLSNWNPQDYDFTQGEIDNINAAIAELEFEIMNSMIGVIIASVRASGISGCLLCDGSIYDKGLYPELYNILDPVFHIDTSSFRVPDYMGKVLISSQSGVYNVGDEGGQETVALTPTNIPSHNHTYEKTTGIPVTVGTGAPVYVKSVIPTTGWTGSLGDGTAHNNMQPYSVVNYYIVAGRA